MRDRSGRRAVRIAWLVGVWLLCWADLSVANVLSGLVVAVAIVTMFDTWQGGTPVVRPVAAARFVGHMAWSMVASSIAVAAAVVRPAGRVYPGVVVVPLEECSDGVATVIADAITLTPGTLTLDVEREPLRLMVHALDSRDPERVRADVARIEQLVIAAFGTGGS